MTLGKRQGESISDLLSRLREPTIAGIHEPQLPGHFATGMGPLSLTFSNNSMYGFLISVIGYIIYRYLL